MHCQLDLLPLRGYDARLTRPAIEVVLILGRRKAGLTLCQAAKRARVSAVEWNQWESGFSGGPLFSQCPRVAKALGLSMNEFFGR